ncbi:hypothetical protein EVAR_39411_1 [Eumeta japonica]|uniref:Uncharacterized protein n=1 Tax=Eumeta variegata TaxID=151549 RepID=A0A4C1YVQ7_EUMVA|nr:hypothetical protein EVAR_39411_1 [Eumeta japonica]
MRQARTIAYAHSSRQSGASTWHDEMAFGEAEGGAADLAAHIAGRPATASNTHQQSAPYKSSHACRQPSPVGRLWTSDSSSRGSTDQ